MESVLPKIREAITPEKYGLKDWLKTCRIKRNFYDGKFYLPKRWINLAHGYDCFEAAVTARDILRGHGISCDIYEGVDMMGIWDYHYFVITSDNKIVDPVDLYPIVGASHLPQRRCSEEEIEQQKRNRTIPFQGLVPLTYQRQKETKILSRIGVTSPPLSPLEKLYMRKDGKNPPSTQLTIYITMIEEGSPKKAVSWDISFDERTLSEGIRRLGWLPYDATLTESVKRLEELEKEGFIRIVKKGYLLYNPMPGILEVNEVNLRYIDPGLEGEIYNQANVLIWLLQQFPSCDIYSISES